MRCVRWISGLVVLVAAACDFPRLPRLVGDDGGVGNGSGGGTDTGGIAGAPDTRSFGPSEFAAGRLVDMTFDRVRGSLTPNAYTYGGLVAHGVPNVKLWTTDETAWSRVASVVPAGAGLWRGESIGAGDPLDNVGIPAAAQKLTMWLEGEVWLVQGLNEQFSLRAGDFAFFQIASPGSNEYGAAIEGRPTPLAVATPVSGWYPIRIGLAYDSANHGFAFQHSDIGGSPVAWTRDRLRARASELTGPLRTVFFRQILGGGSGPQPPVSHVDDVAPAMTTTFPSELRPVRVGRRVRSRGAERCAALGPGGCREVRQALNRPAAEQLRSRSGTDAEPLRDAALTRPLSSTTSQCTEVLCRNRRRLEAVDLVLRRTTARTS